MILIYGSNALTFEADDYETMFRKEPVIKLENNYNEFNYHRPEMSNRWRSWERGGGILIYI